MLSNTKRKRVVYRKTGHGIVVRTPEGITTFDNTKHAKAYFRQQLEKFKQVWLPKSERRGKSFAEVMAKATAI